ncbi:MAG: hypothetical protein M3O82_10435 [Verrucomicrobiota bacterium]|nr:hypothetical protein [Verrucomicrobiota bacterium]
MKFARFISLALLLGTATSSFAARENPYDVFWQALAPYANLIAKETKSPNPNRAVTAELTLADMPPEAHWVVAENEKVHIALQYPDKLRVSSAIAGEEVTIARNGGELWATPGEKISALIDLAAPPAKTKKKDKLENFELPFSEKALVFLPALFNVADAGDAQVGDAQCRVLDVKLMPELARATHSEGWSARVWIRSDHSLAKLQLNDGERRYSAFADRVVFATSLPPETWQPEGSDVMRLSPSRFKQALSLIAPF